MKNVSKEAHLFYSNVALLKCVRRFSDFLIESNAVHYNLKASLRQLLGYMNRFDGEVSNSVEESDKGTWNKEWSERDFEVYSSVNSSMNNMNEQQRETLEQVATAILKGEFMVELQNEAA